VVDAAGSSRKKITSFRQFPITEYTVRGWFAVVEKARKWRVKPRHLSVGEVECRGAKENYRRIAR